MEGSSNAGVVTKMYDFLKLPIPHINQYPRDQRFIPGTRTETPAMEVLELMIEKCIVAPTFSWRTLLPKNCSKSGA